VFSLCLEALVGFLLEKILVVAEGALAGLVLAGGAVIGALLADAGEEGEAGLAKRAADERIFLHLVFFFRAVDTLSDVAGLANDVRIEDGRGKRVRGVGSTLIRLPLVEAIEAGMTG
jgi:hypothetical protein